MTDMPVAGSDGAVQAERYQARVLRWLLACFGQKIASDRIERNHRFLEEALELVQAAGCTQSEARQLVDYVYGRPVGDLGQEVGGTMVCLASLCAAHGIDMQDAGDGELRRVWGMMEKIRAKQAAKPKHSPLPAAADDFSKPPIAGLEGTVPVVLYFGTRADANEFIAVIKAEMTCPVEIRTP